MARILITLRFDGSQYCGWQVQPNGVSVQQRVQDAVECVTGVRSGITGCSRTDSGVHADMYCCTTDTESPLRGHRLAAALNANLPRDIAVYDCRQVPEAFHPRYDAVSKQYVYRIWNSPFHNPFHEKYAIHVRRELDHDLMNRAAAIAVGTHDFAAFCSSGSSVTDTVRTVLECGVRRDDDMVAIRVRAGGFLYNMVRILAGTLIEIGSGRRDENAIALPLTSLERQDAGYTAPPRGLMLERVFYPESGGDLYV